MLAQKDRRLFIRLDLDYPDHPKIMMLSDAAFRAHITLLTYARKYKTDGVIGNRVANRVASAWDTDVLAELQSNDEASPSLIRLPSGDFYLHGYEDMQETRAEIEARTSRNSRNGAKGGRPRKTQSVTESLTQSGTQKKAEIEIETETEREVAKATSTRTARGSRITSDWMPSPDLIDQMRAECPGVNLEAEHRVFIDYWIAQPGQKGVKVDWEATWRNWMRRKQGDTRTRPAPPQSRTDEAQSFIQRLEAIDATRGSGEAAGDRQELR